MPNVIGSSGTRRRELVLAGYACICLLAWSAGETAPGQSPDANGLERRIAELTPDVCIEHTFGDDLRLKGYSVGEAVSSDKGGKRISLDQRREFPVTLFFEQLRIEADHYQVMLRGDDIPYDPRTGLSYAQAPESERFHQKKLPVDLARGQIDAVAGQAGGTIRLTLRVCVPYFIIREGRTDLKLVLIMPDGAVTDSQFLDHFAITYSDFAPRGSENVRLVVPNPGNLLGNPSFEDTPQVNTPGNWTLWNGPGAMQFLDAVYAVHGTQSLRLDFFGGVNPHVYYKYQEVTVKPDTDYDLSWYVKSDNITSKSGPGFAVYDAEKGWDHFVVLGKEVLGTTPWRREQFAFHTPPDTTRIRVFLQRRGGTEGMDDWKAAPEEDTLISGSAWFDLIELVEKTSQR